VRPEKILEAIDVRVSVGRVVYRVVTDFLIPSEQAQTVGMRMNNPAGRILCAASGRVRSKEFVARIAYGSVRNKAAISETLRSV
jgi:hypothetical protein